MKKYLSLPYIVLVILPIILFANSLLVTGHTNFNLQDTYFVIANSYIERAMALCVLGFWMIYLVAGKVLQIGSLAKLHIYTWLAFLGIWMVCDWVGWPQHQPRDVPLKYDDIEKFSSGWIDVFYASIIILFLFGLMCFLLNIVISVFRIIVGRGASPTPPKEGLS